MTAHRQAFVELDLRRVAAALIVWTTGWTYADPLLALLIGFPTAYFIATRPLRTRAVWVFLITIPYWVNLLIRTVSMKFLLRDQGPMNDFLIWSGLLDAPISITLADVLLGRDRE